MIRLTRRYWYRFFQKIRQLQDHFDDIKTSVPWFMICIPREHSCVGKLWPHSDGMLTKVSLCISLQWRSPLKLITTVKWRPPKVPMSHEEDSLSCKLLSKGTWNNFNLLSENGFYWIICEFATLREYLFQAHNWNAMHKSMHNLLTDVANYSLKTKVASNQPLLNPTKTVQLRMYPPT